MVEGRCPVCRREGGTARHRQRKYGLSLEGLAQLKEQQNNQCGICGCWLTEGLLVVDHDHDTGVVRGLLCRWCNLAIGFLKDDAELVERAVSYLNQTSHSDSDEVHEFGLGE